MNTKKLKMYLYWKDDIVDITIIYGNTKKANTYNCVQMLLSSFRLTIPINITEFFLQKNSTYNSNKFFSFSINGENISSPFISIDYLINSFNKSDLIILACPVVTCDITDELKSLLEHLIDISTQNNIRSSMNSKMGLVISTATGAGLSYNTNKLRRNLILLGITNVFKFSKTIYEMDWEHVPLKTKIHIHGKISKISNKILKIYINSSPVTNAISSKIISYKIKLIPKNRHNNIINFNFRKKTFL